LTVELDSYLLIFTQKMPTKLVRFSCNFTAVPYLVLSTSQIKVDIFHFDLRQLTLVAVYAYTRYGI